MNKSLANNPFLPIIARIKKLKARKAEHARINALTKELIQVVKNPDDNAAKKIAELVRQGADINTFDMDKERSLLHFAAEQNRMDVVRALVENGCKSYINVNDSRGKDPAFYAIDNDNPEMLDYLLSHGVSVKRPVDFNLESSFHYAVRLGKHEMVKIELKHGADVNDHVGETFILYGRYEKVYPGPTPLADLMVGKEDENSSSENAPRIYDVKMIKLLIDNGARIDLGDSYNYNMPKNIPPQVVRLLQAQNKAPTKPDKLVTSLREARSRSN